LWHIRGIPGEDNKLNLQPSLQMALDQGSFNLYLLLALLIMLIAGALGGLVNHYLAERQFGEGRRHDAPSLRRYLILGMATALTAPLFLALLSSNLLESIRMQPSQLYVFAAFCLVYVVLAQRLFEHPAGGAAYRQRQEALHQEVAQLRQEQAALHQYLEPVLAAIAEQQALKNEPPREALTYNDVEILRALADESYVYGNLAALTEKTALGRELISQRLAILKNIGLIETRISDKNVLHWVISARGRQALAGILAGQDGEQENLQDASQKIA
jgi:DNA-binding transcriptional ArsR family regulator